MKKTLLYSSFFMIVFALCACNFSNNNQQKEDVGSLATEFTSETSNDANGIAHMDDYTMIHYKYCSLKDFIDLPTDVVKARFIRRTADTNKRIYYYEFEIMENVRGLGLEKSIVINAAGATHSIIDNEHVGITYTTGDITYDEGKTYLLLLTRSRSKNSEGYDLNFINGSLIIPIDTNGNAYLKPNESTIYGGEYLGDHLGDEKLANLFKSGTLEEYVASLIKDNPTVKD